MAQDKSSKKKISAQTQNEIAFGEVVLARLEAFEASSGGGQSEPSSEPSSEPETQEPPSQPDNG